jgi:pimeloyl-ACP methyl ester carboxylesterase
VTASGEIVAKRTGSGPELLLVHGGSSARTTWRALEGLSEQLTLVTVHRRGYPPSPPGDHDFELDARDLAPLLATRPHVLAHSYGVLGALIAAAEDAEHVRSLTVIEPPLFDLVRGDPEVDRIEELSGEVLSHGLEADPSKLRAFLRLAGAEDVPDGPLPEKLAHTVRRAHGGRLPSEARPRLAALREAGVPALVVSGGHSAALERICDALAERLGGERLVLAGAGHFVQRDPRFTGHLMAHLQALDAQPRQ